MLYHRSDSNPNPRFFPEVGAPQSELLAFRDRTINPWSVYRNSHMGRIGLSMAYFLGRQWSEIDLASAFDGVRGAMIREVTDDAGDGAIVRPVTNKIDPAIEQEVIALCSRRWTPKIPPTSNDPRIKAAAKVANDTVNYRLEQLRWPEKRHQHALLFATGGTGLLYTAWDRSFFDLHTIGAPSAVYCQSCNLKLYSDEVPIDTLRLGMTMQENMPPMPVAHLESAREVSDADELVPSGIPTAKLTYCPHCHDRQNPLIPYTPNEDEAADAIDVFGRPIGVDAPRGASTMEVDLPWEWYPQDGGARCTPDTIRRMGRRKIRSLEWLEERYPHLVDQVPPDSISDLLYGDPIFGSQQFVGSYSPVLDSGILDNNVNVDEVFELPSFRHRLGRYMACVKDLVLEEGPLLEEGQVASDPSKPDDLVSVYVPRCQEAISRYKIRPGEIWGTGQPDHHISKQNRLNGLDAQVIEARLRQGSPNIALPKDMWPMEGPSHDSAYGSGKILLLEPSLSQPGFDKPVEIGDTLMNDSVYLERDRILSDFKEDIGRTDIGGGNAPKNIGTTSGLQFLAEQDDKSRSLREEELVGSVESACTHIMRLEWILRTDDEQYQILERNDVWKIGQYRGNALRGQVQVKIERGSFIAKSIMQREAAREAIADKIIIVDGPVTRRRLSELYGLDTDYNEETNNQVDSAERIWVDFVDKKQIPVLDPLDDAGIHYDIFRSHIESEEGEQLAVAADWDTVLRQIAGWEDDFRQQIEMEAKSIAFYGGRLTGDDAKMAYAQATLAYQRKEDLYKRQVELAGQQKEALAARPPEAAAVLPPVVPIDPGIPPMPPPPPTDFSQLLQQRILDIWRAKIAEAEQQTQQQAPAPPPLAAITAGATAGLQPDEQGPYVEFRAYVMACKMTASGAPSPAPAIGTGSALAAQQQAMAPPSAPASGPPPAPSAGPTAGTPPAVPPNAPLPKGGMN